MALFSQKKSRANLPPIEESVLAGQIAAFRSVRQVASQANITTRFDPSSLPTEALAQADKEGIPHNEIHGVLYKDTVYIVQRDAIFCW